MKIKKIYIFLILFFLLIFLIFYKSLKIPNIYEPSSEIEKNVPVFEAKAFSDEEIINSKDVFVKDKFYLVNIWASWCIPCREEHVFLSSLSNEENLELIGINYRDKKINAENFLLEYSNPYKTIISDKKGTVSIEFGAYGVPESFLIYDNEIKKRYIGAITKSSYLEIKNFIK